MNAPTDHFAHALAELRRIDRECREEHARFMEASRETREAFDTALANTTNPASAYHGRGGGFGQGDL